MALNDAARIQRLPLLADTNMTFARGELHRLWLPSNASPTGFASIEVHGRRIAALGALTDAFEPQYSLPLLEGVSLLAPDVAPDDALDTIEFFRRLRMLTVVQAAELPWLPSVAYMQYGPNFYHARLETKGCRPVAPPRQSFTNVTGN